MWAKKYDQCKKCGGCERPHEAKGLCKKCYDRKRTKSAIGRAKSYKFKQKRKVLRRIESMKKGLWWDHLDKSDKLLKIRYPKTNEIVSVPVLKGSVASYETELAIEIFKEHLNEQR